MDRGWAEEALWCPPTQNTGLLKLAPLYEKIGVALNLPMSGVHMVEVVKQLYKPIATPKAALIVPSLRAAFNNIPKAIRENHE